MRVTLQYFDGCPNWEHTDSDLATLQTEGAQIEVEHHLINTVAAAAEAGFRGSPTVLVDGVDPFADPDAPIGLACRVYRTSDSFRGSPTLDQLRTAISTDV